MAATSEPMNPAPITTTRGSGPEAARPARMPRQSSRVRNIHTPAMPSVPGRLRVAAPVATISPS